MIGMRETQEYLKAQEAAQVMENFLNSFGYKARIKEFVIAMGQVHRTNQQSFTALCVAWLEALAKDEHGHDGRNEASFKLAQKFVAALSKQDRRLPLV